MSPSDHPASPRGVRAPLFAVLALTGLVILAPGAFTSAFAGPPLSEVARWLLVALVWLAGMVAVRRPERRPPWSVLVLLASLLGVQLWAGSTSTAVGWRAEYTLLDAPPARAQFAWRHGVHDYRLEPVIDFDGTSAGLHFLNDLGRYGAAISPTTRDVSVPVLMEWTGIGYLPEGGPLTVRVTGRGAVRVTVNGTHLIDRQGPEVSEFASTAALPAGPVSVAVRYEKPSGVAPKLIVVPTSPISGAVTMHPFHRSATEPFPQPQVVDWSGAAVFAAVGLCLGAVTFAYQPISGLAALLRAIASPSIVVLVVYGALLFSAGRDAIPFLHTTFHLWSGDDPLAYVGNGRGILLEGWLMPNGRPIGQGEPFYFYPLFPYVIALAHRLIGEDFSVVRLVNGWAVCALVPLTWLLGLNRLPWWSAAVGTIALGWFIHAHMLPYALIGYTDSLFTGVVFATLALCVRSVRAGGWWAVGAGVACALAAATRPSFLTFTPLFLTALVLIRRDVPMGQRLRTAGGVAAGFVLGLAPFALRNLIVARKAVVLVSSWIQLPYFLVPPEVAPNPVPAMFDHNPSLVESVGAVLRIFAADPVGVIGLELRKVAFTLGMTHWGMPGGSVLHPELLVLTALFIAVMVTRRLPAALRLTLGTFAVSHLVAMVLAAPWTYGYKTILPLHAVFLFAAVHLLPGAALPDPPPAPRDSHVARS